MAITSMVSENDLAQYPDARKVVFGGQEFYVRTHHQGCVLRTYESNHYDDSDWYAVYWDEEKQTVETDLYASTRFWSYLDHAEADITPENLEKALAVLRIRWEASLRAKSEREAQAVAKGKQVRVVKGRKVTIGTVGEVKWMGECCYGYNKTTRVGILVEGQD